MPYTVLRYALLSNSSIHNITSDNTPDIVLGDTTPVYITRSYPVAPHVTSVTLKIDIMTKREGYNFHTCVCVCVCVCVHACVVSACHAHSFTYALT